MLFVSSNLTRAYNLWRTVKFAADQNHKISVFIMKKYLSQNYDYFIKSDISINYYSISVTTYGQNQLQENLMIINMKKKRRKTDHTYRKDEQIFINN